MPSQQLWNGGAQVKLDNGSGLEATRNAFFFRTSVAAVPTTETNIGNATFEAEAGIGITLNYDIRKFGGGVELGAPDVAFIRIFKEDDDNNGVSVDVDEFQSADLIGGASLPRTGTVSFTPTKHGTYRIALELRRGTNNFGGTSQDWRIFSDGGFDRGGLAEMTTSQSTWKGRLRWGVDASTITVTERGSTAPSKFAFTMNAAGIDSEEAVRVDAVFAASQNQQVAGTHTFRLKQRRNGTSTIDVNVASSIVSATQHRSETKVTRISYPNEGVDQSYDVLVTVETNSTLHANNSPQYTGLGGQAADGVWTYFTAAPSGGSLTDYKTLTKTATHNVDAGGSVENVGAYSAKNYAEDGDGIPSVAEAFSFIFTDDNMNVKSGRVLNSRSEALGGVFVVTEVKHAASGTNVTTWGNNDAAFKTKTSGAGKGWQTTSRTVTVTTPPSGIYTVQATGYFPGTAFGTPASREFGVVRLESGSPASASAGKDWIAPASFSTAFIDVQSVVKGGVAVPFTVSVYDKQADGTIVRKDADSTPTVRVEKRTTSGEYTLHAEPVLTKRAATTGLYDGTFTPDAVSGGNVDIYQIAADVTVGSFKRRWSEPTTAIPYSLVDPTPKIVVGAGDTLSPDTHWHPGKSVTIGAAAFQSGAMQSYTGTPTVRIARFNPATGQLEWLQGDGATWSSTVTAHNMSASPGDPKIALKSYAASTTETWNTEDLFIIVEMMVGGSTYYGSSQMLATGKFNHHDKNAFDPTGLFA